MSVFEVLSSINVNEHTEKKAVGGKELTYLSWAWAWAEVKKIYPDANYNIWRDEKGLPYVYDPATGYMVFTDMTIEGQTYTMWLSVMDGANNAMKSEPYSYKVKNPSFKYAKLCEDGKYRDKYGNEQPEYIVKSVDAATMTDINKTIMRCLVKNLAMFGLGLYIYAGEDLPESESGPTPIPEDKQFTPPAVNTDVVVSIESKLPPKPTELERFLLQVMGEFRRERDCTSAENKRIFNAQYEALKKASIIPDKPMQEYTLEEAATMVDAMRKCFDLNGTELKTE